ncbi:MAG: pyridoxamine 5'-phosphate oxidase family protein [Bacteroidales bacterium]|nr:pyridoxamine 5'-phosphate oxidase family protein [Bacteroidales bacterium]
MFREPRRKDRILGNEEARQLLRDGEYGYLSLCGINGYGYGIPISYACEENKIYFHCAPEGFKLDSIKENNKASFCVVGKTQVIPGDFSTAYESTVVFGKITENLSVEERLYALRLLVKKYSPGYEQKAEKYIKASFGRTNVLRLDIEHLTGKCKRIKPTP